MGLPDNLSEPPSAHGARTGVCPSCGSANPPDSKFCGDCGTGLAAPTGLSGTDSPYAAGSGVSRPADEPGVLGGLVLGTRAPGANPPDPRLAPQAAGAAYNPLAAGTAGTAPPVPPYVAAGPGAARRPKGSVGRSLGVLGEQIYKQLPGEYRVVQIAVPAILATVAVGILSGRVATVLAVLWALIFVLSVLVRMSGTPARPRARNAAVCCYWSALGLICAAPDEALIAVAAVFLLWTSARPGQEWIPWPKLYSRLLHQRRKLLEKIAAVNMLVVPAAALVGTLLFWLVPDVDKGMVWFVGFGLAALFLLGLTTAGQVVPATRALGQIAMVLLVFALASVPDLRIPLVVATALLIPVVWALPPRPSPGSGGTV